MWLFGDQATIVEQSALNPGIDPDEGSHNGYQVAHLESYAPEAIGLLKESYATAATMVAFAHDMILTEGGTVFAQKCIHSKLGHGLSCEDRLKTHLFSMLFVVVIPFSASWIFAQQFPVPEFGYTRAAPGLKNTFDLDNMAINMTELLHSLAFRNSSQAPDFYLRNQQMQSQLGIPSLHLYIASCTIVLMILLYFARALSDNFEFMKANFVMAVLHSLWFSDEYPKLRYTHRTFFGIKLFRLVPCAWLATVCAIALIIPAWAAVSDDEGSGWELAHRLVKFVPGVTIAAWAFGKTYMAAANASAGLWLLNDDVVSIAQAMLTQAHGGVFSRMFASRDMMTLMTTQIEALAKDQKIEKALKEESSKLGCSVPPYKLGKYVLKKVYIMDPTTHFCFKAFATRTDNFDVQTRHDKSPISEHE